MFASPAETIHSCATRPCPATCGVASTVSPSSSNDGVTAEATSSRSHPLIASRTRPPTSHHPGGTALSSVAVGDGAGLDTTGGGVNSTIGSVGTAGAAAVVAAFASGHVNVRAVVPTMTTHRRT